MQPSAIPEFETHGRAILPVVRNSSTGSLYDAGANTRRSAGWRAPTASANAGVLANLTTVRDRSRAATRNDGYAKGIIGKLVSNIIGTGIKPMSLAADRVLRERLQALWLLWTDECDADGQLDFYGLQALAVRTWLEGGDSFTRLRDRDVRDGLWVPMQLQVLEPELCPHTHNVWNGTQRIRAGIEFSPIGKRVAYWFHPSRPELDDFDATQLRRVPADSVCHLFDLQRAGQLRGLPQLTQALIALNELSKYRDASLLRQQLANMFVAFVKRPPSTTTTEALHPLTGAEIETSEDDKPMLSLEPGLFQELEPGEEVDFSEPPAPNGYAEFMSEQLRSACAAADIPYEVVTGDMRGVNDRTARVLLHEFRRRIQMWQHQVVGYQWCRRIWTAWMDRVFLSGALPIPNDYLVDPTPYTAVKWVPQGWPYLNPVQDVEAAVAKIRGGLTSRAAAVSELGEDVEAIDAEQAADNARADSLGLRHDSDGRQAKTAAAPPPAQPEPEPAGAPA